MSLLAAVTAAALVLQSPIDCTLGTDCFIQNYVDHDATRSARDFMCSHLSYDGHKGTDFRLKNLAHMQRSVKVLAAASGTVMGTRDGMEDISIRDAQANPNAIKNRECGNGVRLSHEGGYTTQYCHLKRGSIRVKQGQPVSAGDVLGEVGLSGETEFPHVHVQLADSEGNIIDPFAPDMKLSACNRGTAPTTLWSDQSHVSYQPAGVLQMGFADKAPTMQEARAGTLDNISLSRNSSAIIVWAELFGLSAGDVLTMTITAPDGSNVVTHQQDIEANKAVYFQFAGRKRKGEWITGEYKAHLSVVRANRNVVNRSSVFDIQ